MTGCLDKPMMGINIHFQNREAFEKLYENYSPAIFGEILRIVKNRETAEDLLQDVFLTIWHKGDQFDPNKGALFTWMISITRHKCIDYLRRAINNQTFYPLETIQEKVLEHQHELLEFSLLYKHLQKLSPEHIELVRLIYVYGYTHHEVSHKCHIPKGTVKTILRKFVSKTKAHYSTEHSTPV